MSRISLPLKRLYIVATLDQNLDPRIAIEHHAISPHAKRMSAISRE